MRWASSTDVAARCAWIDELAAAPGGKAAEEVCQHAELLNHCPSQVGSLLVGNHLVETCTRHLERAQRAIAGCGSKFGVSEVEVGQWHGDVV